MNDDELFEIFAMDELNKGSMKPTGGGCLTSLVLGITVPVIMLWTITTLIL